MIFFLLLFTARRRVGSRRGEFENRWGAYGAEKLEVPQRGGNTSCVSRANTRQCVAGGKGEEREREREREVEEETKEAAQTLKANMESHVFHSRGIPKLEAFRRAWTSSNVVKQERKGVTRIPG